MDSSSPGISSDGVFISSDAVVKWGKILYNIALKNCLNIIISISGVIIIIITRAHQRRHTLMRSFCCKPLPLAERNATVSPVLSAFL